MNFEENPFMFDCDGEQLLGILAQPSQPRELAVVIVVGGPQYRVGSHRQFVQLSRRLANGGFAALRFDYTGMGDSSGIRRAFDRVDTDIKAAIDALAGRLPNLRGVVLWGLCDGASAAAMYLRHDRRVKGVVLVNPWVRSTATEAKAQLKHYYTARLIQPDFWKKLLTGNVGIAGSLRDLSRSIVRAGGAANARAGGSSTDLAFQDRMADGLQAFAGSVLVVLSGVDLVAREFADFVDQAPSWRGLLKRASVQRIDFPDADHTFSKSPSKQALEDATVAWLEQLCADSNTAKAGTVSKAS